jgi:hypothetical protein
MKLDGSLAIGAQGGHGPIRYVVQEYDSNKFIKFRFLAPKGFCGTHSFEIISRGVEMTELKHTVEMEAKGSAHIVWPFIIRPLHNALVEDALAKVSQELGLQTRSVSWPPGVRFLRWMISGGKAVKKQKPINLATNTMQVQAKQISKPSS